MPPRQSPVTRMPLSRTTFAASARPIFSTWSRQGPMAVMPSRMHASTASRKPNCSRTVARLSARPSSVTVGLGSLMDAANREDLAHAARGELRVAEHPSGVGQPEQRGEVEKRAGALLAADHDEVVLQSVEV